MKVVILCGGQGTRIRDVSETIPKPMISIGHYPIIWHIMKYYAQWGFNEFVLCLGYKGDKLKDFFLNYETNTRDFTLRLGEKSSIEYHSPHGEADWKVTLTDTGLEAMTGARVRKIRRFIDGEDFMLTYGDGLSDIDLSALTSFHREKGRVMTVRGVRPSGRFGELMNTPEGIATEFNEKPQASAGRISGGFFVCRKEIFDYLDDRDDLVLEQEPMRKLVEAEEMAVYEHDGFWQAMDTSREYGLLNKLYEKGRAPWINW